MRIVVFSDTHGSINKCISAVNTLGQVDMIIHLGDVLKDAKNLEVSFPEIPFEYVSGNNDIYSFQTEKMIEVSGKKIFMTHGHIYGVKNSLKNLAEKAKQEQADICLFGHTHKSFDGCEYGVRFLNPGSAKGYVGVTCGIIEIENEKIRTMIWEI